MSDLNLTIDELKKSKNPIHARLLNLNIVQNDFENPRNGYQGRKIDYIFTSQPASIVDMDAPDLSQLSDHRPVVCTLRTTRKEMNFRFPNKHFDYLTTKRLI